MTHSLNLTTARKLTKQLLSDIKKRQMELRENNHIPIDSYRESTSIPEVISSLYEKRIVEVGCVVNLIKILQKLRSQICVLNATQVDCGDSGLNSVDSLLTLRANVVLFNEIYSSHVEDFSINNEDELIAKHQHKKNTEALKGYGTAVQACTTSPVMEEDFKNRRRELKREIAKIDDLLATINGSTKVVITDADYEVLVENDLL